MCLILITNKLCIPDPPKLPPLPPDPPKLPPELPDPLLNPPFRRCPEP